MSPIGPIFQALANALPLIDHLIRTSYSRKYNKLYEIIIEEEKKPIVTDPTAKVHYKDVRDQNKIDEAYLGISRLMEKFNNEKNIKKR